MFFKETKEAAGEKENHLQSEETTHFLERGVSRRELLKIGAKLGVVAGIAVAMPSLLDLQMASDASFPDAARTIFYFFPVPVPVSPIPLRFYALVLPLRWGWGFGLYFPPSISLLSGASEIFHLNQSLLTLSFLF